MRMPEFRPRLNVSELTFMDVPLLSFVKFCRMHKKRPAAGSGAGGIRVVHVKGTESVL